MPDDTTTTEIKPAIKPLATRAQTAAKAVVTQDVVTQSQLDVYTDSPESWIRAESVIHRHILSHYEAGAALAAVKKYNLHRYSGMRGFGINTIFADVIKALFPKMSVTRAYQLIEYSKLIDNMRAVGAITITDSTIVESAPVTASNAGILDTSNQVAGVTGNQVASATTPGVVQRLDSDTTRRTSAIPTESQGRQLKDVPPQRLQEVWTLARKYAYSNSPGARHITKAKAEVLGPPSAKPEPPQPTPAPHVSAGAVSTRQQTLLNNANTALGALNTAELTVVLCQIVSDKPVRAAEVLKALYYHCGDSEKLALTNQIFTILGELPADVLRARGYVRV